MRKVLIEILKKYKWQIIALITMLWINIYILTCPPKIIGKIIDLLYDIDANQANIIKHIWYLLGSCVLLLVVRIIWKHLEVIINRGIESKFKTKIFKRFLSLKETDIQSIKNGEIMSYFVKDVNEIRRVTHRVLSLGTRTIFTFIIAIYQMINGINLKLTIAVIIPILIGICLITKIKKYIETNFKKSQENFQEMSEYIQESTDSIKTTKAYSCEGKNLKDFIRKNRRVRQSNNIVDVYTNLLKMSLKICFGRCYRNNSNLWLKTSSRRSNNNRGTSSIQWIHSTIRRPIRLDTTNHSKHKKSTNLIQKVRQTIQTRTRKNKRNKNITTAKTKRRHRDKRPKLQLWRRNKTNTKEHKSKNKRRPNTRNNRRSRKRKNHAYEPINKTIHHTKRKNNDTEKKT